jgi:hypothetical protein
VLGRGSSLGLCLQFVLMCGSRLPYPGLGSKLLVLVLGQVQVLVPVLSPGLDRLSSVVKIEPTSRQHVSADHHS